MDAYNFSFSELRSLASAEFDSQLHEFFEPDEVLSYQVRRPSAQQASGLLIYISPKPGATLPEKWGRVLDQHNLTWVGAENSGNEVHVARRVGMALLAFGVARKLEDVDTDRTWLTGFSGGGRVATMMIPAYPELFAGAVFVCGANPLFTATPEALEALQDKPLVFLTGTGDFNLEDTQMAISTYQSAGLNARLMIVDGLGHALPEAADLDAALST